MHFTFSADPTVPKYAHVYTSLYIYTHSVPSMPRSITTVLDPGKGVCADPVGRVAILEVEGPGPPVGVSERQLSPDRGGEKT